MKEFHDITVVCPTFNSEKFIEQTINSIFLQSMTVSELIISDDGSSDQTIKIIEECFKKYKGNIACKLLKNPHLGPGAARNTAIKAARGDWIAFIDSDDLWEENKIHEVSSAIMKNPEVNFICHNEYRLSLNGNKTIIFCGSRYDKTKSILEQLFKANMISTSATVCKKSLLLNYGLFDESLMSIQDYELWLRITPNMSILFLDKILGTYVERRANITLSRPLQRFQNELLVIFKYRKIVPLRLFYYRILRLIISHSFQILKRLF